MPLNFDFRPAPSVKAVFWGLEGRGKTHGAAGLVAMTCKLLGLTGDIGAVATESWIDDWYDRLSRASGKRIAPLMCIDDEGFASPSMALEFIRECERAKNPDGSPTVSILMLDNMTDLQDGPRRKLAKKLGKPLQFQHYAQADKDYNTLVEYLRHTRLHWVATARETDDKQETDGAEIVIGKKAKSKINEVARLKVHCQGGRVKGGEPTYDWHVVDTGGESKRYTGKPTAAIWTEHLQRYIADREERRAESRGGASRAKGARGENEIARYLKSRRYAVMRSRQFKRDGGNDPDLLAVNFAGGRALKLECKNRKSMPAKCHVDALEQAEKAGEGMALAVAKVARKPIGQAVVTLRLDEFLTLYESACALQAAMVADAVQAELDGPGEFRVAGLEVE